MGVPTGSGPSPGPSPAPSPSPSPPTPVSASTPTPADGGLSLGPPDASTSALDAAFDEPVLTDIDTGADQLLSTAVADGLSDPFATVQDGWVTAPQDVDPFTLASSAADPFVGADVNSYTNAAAGDAIPNSYTGSQNVEPFTGTQDAAPAPDGRGTTAATTASPILAFGVDAGTADNAGSTWLGYIYDANGNVVAAQFQDSQGAISYYFFDNGSSPAPVGSAHVFPELDLTESKLPPPGTPPPPDFVPEPGQPNSAIQPTPQPSATPAPTPSPTPPPAPSPTPSNPTQSATPPAPQPAPPPDQPTPPLTQQPGPPTSTPQPAPAAPSAAPFDPMADSPFAKWLLYGKDTPILDFLTNDSHLQVAQNVAAGVAIGAATVATGGMLLEAAPGAFAAAGTAAQSASASMAAAAQSAAMNPLAASVVGSGAIGMIAKSPELEEELAEGAETLGPELEEALPSTAERAATTFQDIVRQADRFLRSNPDLIMELGGSSKGAPISPNQLGAAIGQYAEGNPAFARALGGNALEAVVNAIIEDLPPGTGSFMQVSGPGRIDFIGTGDFAGYTFELTTEAGVAGHALRAYMQQPGAMIFTYIPFIE